MKIENNKEIRINIKENMSLVDSQSKEATQKS